MQDWDTDKAQFTPEVTGNALNGYPDEHYVDVRSDLVVGIMKKRIKSAADIGCDATDPDNIDAFVSASSI